MAKTKERLLADLRRIKNSCTLPEAEKALTAWDFTLGKSKGHARVWNYKHVTVTVHVPHGKSGKMMDPGAVATVIKKIEEAAVLQMEEKKDGD